MSFSDGSTTHKRELPMALGIRGCGRVPLGAQMVVLASDVSALDLEPEKVVVLGVNNSLG